MIRPVGLFKPFKGNKIELLDFLSLGLKTWGQVEALKVSKWKAKKMRIFGRGR